MRLRATFMGRLCSTAFLAAVLIAAAPLRADVDRELQSKIQKAIQRGREALLPSLIRNVKNPPGGYPMGRIALPLAAALKSGLHYDSPIAVAAFKKLDSLPLLKTYGVSCYLFALDARHRASAKQTGYSSGRTRSRNKNKIDAKLHAEIKRAVDWLVEARAEKRGHWGYDPQPPGAGRHDFSNSQFAILGLQIGLEHRIPIPRIVFEEIADCFLRSQYKDGKARELSVTKQNSIEDIILGRTRTRATKRADTIRVKVQAGGWGYTRGARDPYASMTAAGASSLIVVHNAIGNTKIGKEVELALYSSYRWIADRFDDYITGNKHYYYTLYSLEKVGDLAGIAKFDGQDWYEQGARELLDRQLDNGSWGNYSDTSLALMFLTRASRLHSASPVILTSTVEGKDGQKNDDSSTTDYVYLSRTKGFVSARETLLFIGSSRKSGLLGVAREIVENYAPHAKLELAAPLLGLWQENDAITKFAKSALKEITGLSSKNPKDYEAWIDEYEAIREIAKNPEALTSEALAERYKQTQSHSLKLHLVQLAHRLKLYGVTGDLIADMAALDDDWTKSARELRGRTHSYLLVWTGRQETTPDETDRAAWQTTIGRWQDWWTVHHEKFTARITARRLIRNIEALSAKSHLLDGGKSDKQLAGWVDELVALGDLALEPLKVAMSQGEFSFHLIDALERLTGKAVGLRLK